LFNLLDFPVRELSGKTFGIIGYGTLGRAVADVARAFGMRVIVAERRGATARDGRLPFDTVLAEADVLSLHCPLDDATRGLIGADELARMKHDALLINTARGAIVDSAALAGALAAQQLGGAGIDVLPVEPPNADEPLIKLDLPNLVITPHIAWAALEARQRAIDEMAANIRAFRNGGTRNRVV
jgi:glycerate dehydrogenase